MFLTSTSIDVGTATPTFYPPALTRAAPLSFYDDFIPRSGGDGDSQLQRWSSLIGIVTAIVGNILISFALNIQRYAHIRLHKEKRARKEKARRASKALRNGYQATSENASSGEEGSGSSEEEDDPLTDSFQSSPQSLYSRDGDDQDSYLRSPYWWGGIVLMTVGEAGNFLAYGFAPASIVSPLGVVALISNCVIAPFMLKEKFRLRDFWGVVIAVAGAVTVVLSAKQEEKKLGPHEIWDAVTRTEFEVYMAITILLMGLLLWASPKYGNKTILVDLGLVGLFGGYTALATKGVASMLSSTLWRAFTTPVTYLLLVILFGTAVMQVKYVNKALQRFDSTQVIPVQFVMFTLSVIIGSAILFRDFEKATTTSMMKFVFGCLLTFSGVYLITTGREQEIEVEDDRSLEEDGEDRIILSHQTTREDLRHPDGAPETPEITRKGALFQGYDGVDDDSARRSSRVSFSEPSPRPQRSRMYSNSSIRIQTPTTSSELFPGNENTPLLINPWKNSSDDLLQAAKHPGIRGATSSPVLPSEAQLPSTGDSRPPTNRSSTHDNMHTHPALQKGPQPPQADRPYTPARHSISRMMPGPLLSPLSGGLSVVIADSLRRSIEIPARSRPIRKARSALRRSKPGPEGSNEEETSEESGPSNGDPISQSLQTERSTWAGVTRARSLSNTLNDLFRGKRQKTGKDDDVEAGPSEL